MKINLTGLVINEKNYNENDKLITVLSNEIGLTRILICDAKKNFNKNLSSSQIFSYSKFTVYKGKSGLLFNDVETIKNFFEIKTDLKKLALSEYFFEIIFSMPDLQYESSDFLRLILNSLFFLSKDKLNANLIKCIFELRSCSLAGYMPNLVGCNDCGNFNAAEMYFFIGNGFLKCKNCISKTDSINNEVIALKKSVILAMRHIIYSKLEKLFSFSVNGESEYTLCNICEKYLLNHINYNFKSLKIYKNLNL